MLFRNVVGLALTIAIGLSGCDETGPREIILPEPLVIVATPATTDTAVAEPLQALVVEVRDSTGELLSDVAVRFMGTTTEKSGFSYVSMYAGSIAGGFAHPYATITNDRGRAVALVKLGQFAGPAGIEISVPEFGLVDTVPFTIMPGKAAGLRLQPQDTALALGRSLTIAGGVIDRFGNVRADPITFAGVPAPASAGTVSASGLVTATGVGRIDVIGSSGQLSDTIAVSVVPVGTVAGYDFGNGRLVMVDLDGSNRRNITLAPVTPGQDFEPSWSPDGNALTFTTANGVAIVNVATGTVSTIPVTPSPYWPAFAPDGLQIYFSVYDGSTARIARMNRDGSAFGVITQGPFDSRVSFAPHGRTIVYHAAGGGEPMITFYDLGTSTVIGAPRSGLFPEWSPVGDRIAFFSLQNELRVMNPDGTDDQFLAGAGFYQVGPTSWSPDGRWLLLVRNGGIELLGMSGDVKGVTVRPVLNNLGGVIWKP